MLRNKIDTGLMTLAMVASEQPPLPTQAQIIEFLQMQIYFTLTDAISSNAPIFVYEIICRFALLLDPLNFSDARMKALINSIDLKTFFTPSDFIQQLYALDFSVLEQPNSGLKQLMTRVLDALKSHPPEISIPHLVLLSEFALRYDFSDSDSKWHNVITHAQANTLDLAFFMSLLSYQLIYPKTSVNSALHHLQSRYFTPPTPPLILEGPIGTPETRQHLEYNVSALGNQSRGHTPIDYSFVQENPDPPFSFKQKLC